MAYGLKHNYITFHRSPVVLFFEFLQAFVPLSLLFMILYFSGDTNDPAFFNDPAVLLPVYRTLGILLLLELTRRYFDHLYVFGHKRIIHFQGLLSLKTKRTSISYEDIKEIRVKQTVSGRLFRYGSLQFGTSSTDSREITFDDIPFPERLSGAVEELVNRKRNEFCPLSFSLAAD